MSPMKSSILVVPILALALLFGLSPEAKGQASGVVSFQQGVGGYTGTLDTQLRLASSNANAGAAINLIADQQDGTVAGVQNPPAQILLRFNDIFGAGPGQIPVTTPPVLIRKAQLILSSTANNADSPGTIGVHRLLQDWTEDCTWASCFGGDSVQNDDIEALNTPDVTFVPNFPNPGAAGNVQRVTNDVIIAVQAWADGAVNYGWVLTNSSTDGYRMDSSENGTMANRPLLLVEYGECTPPSFTQPPASATVEQCRTATFTVQVTGSTPITLQWNKDGFPISTLDNPSAATPTLVLTNVQSGDAANYTVTAVNECGSPTSDPPAVLMVTDDTTAPTIVSATFDAYDFSRLVVNFSEPMADIALETFSWGLTTPSGGVFGLAADGTFTTANSDQAAFVLETPRNVTESYTLIANQEIADRCTSGNPTPNAIPYGTETPVINPGIGFRQDVNGYTGTQDTEIHEGDPIGDPAEADNPGGSTPGGFNGSPITVDNEDSTPDGARARGLLRFDNIFGSDPLTQVPFGARIDRATLTMSTTDAGDNPTLIYRMLVDWSEATTTWNSLVNGIDDGTNDVEASFFGSLDGSQDEEFDEIDVTTVVQEWANGTSPNYGWAFVATTGNGWDWDTSEAANANERPSLLIQYSVVETNCAIIQEPEPVTVNEGNPFTVSVGASGTGLTYQWYRNNEPIDGATDDSYTVQNAKPSQHGGSYHVEVSGTVPPSPCTSERATVTVVPDTGRPRVVSARGNPDQTTITITFTDEGPLNEAEAETTGNYSLTPTVPVTSAVLNGMVVTLTTAARTPGVSYSLQVKDIHDTAEANNVLNPNPTTISPLLQHVSILAGDATWKYHNVGADLYGTDPTWKDQGYADAAWSSGQILLGWEPGGTPDPRPLLFAQGWNTNNLSLLSRTNTVGGGLNGTNIVDYFRTTVNIPFSLAGAVIRVRHVTDDGAVFYFRGTEVFRYQMAAGTVGYLTPATGTAPEGQTRTNYVSGGLQTGDNAIAVSVHQGAANPANAHTSSDVVFGLELTAIYGATPPTLTIVNNGDGTVTISWSPGGGVLQQSTDLATWTTAASQANPQRVTATGALFFRIAP